MKKYMVKTRGFTIIEVMLFLSISGLMMAGVLALISGTIERQRYKDVVYSTIDYLKGQYNSTSNTHNNRLPTTGCTGGSIQSDTSAGTARGSSDCYIVGRIVRSNDTATSMVSYPVLATRDLTSSAVTSATTEKEVLSSMGLLIDDVTDNEAYSLGYDTFLSAPESDEPQPFSMLVVRVPTSNLLRTFLVTGNGAQNRSLSEIVDSSSNGTLCIESRGLIGSSNNGAQVSTAVSGSMAIEFATGDVCK